MNAVPQVANLPVSFDPYVRQGWYLTPIPPGTKGPRQQGWNRKENCISDPTAIPPGYGVGLAHAYSGTMALDIDDWQYAESYLMMAGVSLSDLFNAPDAVTIKSGIEGHGKLLYRMPEGVVLPSKRLSYKDNENRTKTHMEFRCATVDGLTVQDVLPPSIHPVKCEPYQWGGNGHWTRLPAIPITLLAHWKGLLSVDTERSLRVSGSNINASWTEIQSAISAINPDCSRDDWIACGMALHYAGTQLNQLDEAYSIWDSWSALGSKYQGSKDIDACWRSFNASTPSTVRLGTLFKLANENGWQRPLPDVSDLFPPQSVELISPASVFDALTVPPPDINLDMFPPVLRRRAMEVAESRGADPIVPLIAGLAAVAAVADARTRLELMPGWEVPPVLWLMTIGDPGDKKSPASKPMLSVLHDIEREDMVRYQRDLLKFEALDSAYAASKKAYLQAAAQASAVISGELDHDELPFVLPPPTRPVSLRFTVSDVTSQKLVRMLADRPYGMLCYLDEMASWAMKVTDKMSGEDRSTWTTSYEADRHRFDRQGDGGIQNEVMVDNFALSIFGNLQPRVLQGHIKTLSTDGLLQRFIPVVLRHRMTKRNEPIPDHLTNRVEWETLIRQIHSLGKMSYKLSDEAFHAFRNFQTWYESTKHDERLIGADPIYMQAFAKLEGTCGRLMLIWHMMSDPYSPYVSIDTTITVINFVQTYILQSLRYTYGELGALTTDSLDSWIVEYVVQHAGIKQEITLRDIKRGCRRQIEGLSQYHADELIKSALIPLENIKWVALAHSDNRSTSWMINPQLGEQHRAHRERIAQIKQARIDAIVEASGGRIQRRLVQGYVGT